jgi:hypothetical protein
MSVDLHLPSSLSPGFGDRRHPCAKRGNVSSPLDDTASFFLGIIENDLLIFLEARGAI